MWLQSGSDEVTWSVAMHPKQKSKWPPANFGICQFSPWKYGILPQVLLEFITNNAGLCHIEGCTSVTAGMKASKWVYFQLFLLEVIGKFCFPTMADQIFTACRRSALPALIWVQNNTVHRGDLPLWNYIVNFTGCLFVCLYQSFKISKNTARLAISTQCFSNFLYTGCRKLALTGPNIHPNELKIILEIEKTFLFENMLSVLLDVCLFVCTRASNSAKIPQGRWSLHNVFGSLTGCQENVIFH